jgi:GTP cyclohydrolase III
LIYCDTCIAQKTADATPRISRIRKDLAEFVKKQYNGKVITFYIGADNAIIFECENNHMIRKIATKIGFRACNSDKSVKKKNW